MSKRKKNIQFLDKSEKTECWSCEGKNSKCTTCKGTGVWRKGNYILVAETPKGQKIAFQVDSVK